MPVSRARRWPKVANSHRTDSIDEAEAIIDTVTEAMTALRKSNRDLVLMKLDKIRQSARIIKMLLESAPAGDEDTGSAAGRE